MLAANRRGCRRSPKVCVVVLGLGDDDAVDQDAGDLDLARMERAALGDALDLHDHHAAASCARPSRSTALSSVSASRSIVMLPSGSAVVPRMMRDVDRERLVEQVLLAADRHQRHQVVGGAGVELAAAVARIDEGAEADPR